MDQILALFGRPDKITAFIQNSRGVGHPDVDDSVNISQTFQDACLTTETQFTIIMHFEAGAKLPRPVTAIARAQLLSVRSPQPRYSVLGTKGSYVKYGVDVQEDQLKVISTPTVIHEKNYGVEPENIWGTLECLEEDDITMTKSVYVPDSLLESGFNQRFLDGLPNPAATLIYLGTSLLQSATARSWPSSGNRRRRSSRWWSLPTRARRRA